MKYRIGIGLMIALACVSVLTFLVVSANAIEPQRPDVSRVFDADKDSKINKVAILPTADAFKGLRGADFTANEDVLHKAIFQSFRNRKKEAISLALNYVKSPLIQEKDGEIVRSGSEFYVAKKILQVFPDEAIGELMKLYRAGNSTAKGNVIRVIGGMAGGPEIRDMLVNALDDKTISGEEDPEVAGEPLRICDEAYNQLVLRYRVKNVLRTIGPGHRIEVRDYHIGILKAKLKDLL
jgi:hypothetical protein